MYLILLKKDGFFFTDNFFQKQFFKLKYEQVFGFYVVQFKIEWIKKKLAFKS